MKFYTITWIQFVVVIIYPIVVFIELMENNILNPWIPVISSIIFCALWKNIRIVLTSTTLMGITAVPIWWIFIERFTTQGQESILGWYPLIIFNFLVFVLLPEVFVVLIRNAALKRFVYKSHKALTNH